MFKQFRVAGSRGYLSPANRLYEAVKPPPCEEARPEGNRAGFNPPLPSVLIHGLNIEISVASMSVCRAAGDRVAVAVPWPTQLGRV